MQYYTNGFRPGDPSDNGPVDTSESPPSLVELPETVDVLIVGCGPAGLVLAAQLARFPDIRTRIIEQKSGPLQMGQADGISGRSIEIFQAFGFAERVMKEAYYLEAITFWQHDPARPERIIRTTKKADGRGRFSEFPHVVLNQARIHQFLLDSMQKSPARLVPDYQRRLVDLHVGDASTDFPVSATVERTDTDHAGVPEKVRARYVVGCDGARSTVRQLMNLQMRGDSANKAWGVMDLLLVTDFPDIRIKSIVQSAQEGNLLIIPREGGHLVRFYVEMDKLRESERASQLNITVEQLIDASRRILRPYTLEVMEVVWWSVYEIGQRISDAFANVAPEKRETGTPSVFIVGDACHTHSPKAGQGMNVSMHDSFNLGWKLASVLRGQAAPELLHTYSAERRAIAEELLEFDRELASMFSVPNEAVSVETEIKAGTGSTTEATKLQQYMVKHDGYVSGTLTRYEPSIIVAEPSHTSLAPGLPLGKRFHSCPVVRLADARPVELGHVLEADGRWRIVAFADKADPSAASSRIRQLVRFLEFDDRSPIRRYTPSRADIDSVIELLVVFQQGYLDLDIGSLPGFLYPAKGRYGLQDRDKLFCPDQARGIDIFDERRIDRERGALVIARPDQHVAHTLPLDEMEGLATFFAGFMRPAS